MLSKEIVTVSLPMRFQKQYGFEFEIQYTGGWRVLHVHPGGAFYFSEKIQPTDKIIAVDDVKVTCWNYLKIDELFTEAVKNKRTLMLKVKKGPGIKETSLDKVARRVRKASATLKRSVSSVKDERVSLIIAEEEAPVDTN